MQSQSPMAQHHSYQHRFGNAIQEPPYCALTSLPHGVRSHITANNCQRLFFYAFPLHALATLLCLQSHGVCSMQKILSQCLKPWCGHPRKPLSGLTKPPWLCLHVLYRQLTVVSRRFFQAATKLPCYVCSHSLPSRDIIADSIETVMCGQWYDANISLPGCDKNMPGVILAMARFNRPSIMVYGGTIKPGCSKIDGRDLLVSHTFEAYGESAVCCTAPVLRASKLTFDRNSGLGLQTP